VGFSGGREVGVMVLVFGGPMVTTGLCLATFCFAGCSGAFFCAANDTALFNASVVKSNSSIFFICPAFVYVIQILYHQHFSTVDS